MADDLQPPPVNVTTDQLLRWSLLAKRLAREAGALVKSMQSDMRTPPARDGDDDDGMNPSATETLRTTSDAKGIVDISTKSNVHDLVTRADIASQALIVRGIRSTPSSSSHRIIGEEDAIGDDYLPLTDEPTWIIDAIDGTTNFVHGLHDYCVCIALSVNREVTLGVVYAPVLDEMFFGLRGHGSFLNDVPLDISHLSGLGLDQALVVSEWAYVRDVAGVEQMLRANRNIMVNGLRGMRQLGSGALDMCYVAAGRVNAVYAGALPDKRDAWKIWDYAAASVVVREAGAVVTRIDGSAFDVEADSMITACSERLVAQLVDAVKL